MLTPFNVQNEIDKDALSTLIDFYLAAGVKGFFANCLSSEMYSITESERIELTKHVVDHVNARVPVVATGSFGLTIDDKAEFAKQLYDTGIDAVILITAHYAEAEEDDTILLQNFETMLNLTSNIPIGLYECPAPYKRILNTDTFKTLIDTNRFVYHKDTSIELQAVKEKLAVIDNNNKLEFYDAHTPNAMHSLQMGAKGMSSISGNFYPEIMVWMCNNATNPNRQEEVKWLQQELNRVDPLIHDAYPMSAKYFLQKRGLPVHTISRAHALAPTPQQKKTLDEIHENFLYWCNRLQIAPVNARQLVS